MRQVLPVFLLYCLCVAASCRKRGSDGPPQPALPPVTDTGANTFGCLVDGELFLPKKRKGSWSPPLTCTYQDVSGRLIFTLGALNGQTDKVIVFNIEELSLKDTLLEYNSPLEGNGLSARYYDSLDNEYSTYKGTFGEFRLTRFDQVYGIASGTFWFDAVDTTTHDTVHIREGRFDVKF